jgi:hypothetical protein
METETGLCWNGIFWGNITCSDEEQCCPFRDCSKYITEIQMRISKGLLIAGDSAPTYRLCR